VTTFQQSLTCVKAKTRNKGKATYSQFWSWVEVNGHLHASTVLPHAKISRIGLHKVMKNKNETDKSINDQHRLQH
jgi:hypothetical protein